MMTQPVQPGAAPFTPAFGVAKMADGRDAVVIQFHTQLGPLHFFCSPDEADGIAAGIVQAARQARTGLIVPGTGDATQAAQAWQDATNAAIRGQS
jgi:hypothetical protein